jgi:hypothetical protein
LRAFENRVLRKIAGPKREVTEGKRKLHFKELYNLYPTFHHMLLGTSNHEGCNAWDMPHT